MGEAIEIWKAIPGFEDLYSVSNFGQVRSETRIIKGAYNTKRELKGRILKAFSDKDGYQIVSLRKGNKSIGVRIHQAVAMAFLNHKRCGLKLQVDHIDGDVANNRLKNLQILTAKEHSNKTRNIF